MKILKTSAMIGLLFFTTNLLAADYNRLESDRVRMKQVQKSLNFLLIDFQTMQKNMLMVMNDNKKLRDRVTNLEKLNAKKAQVLTPKKQEVILTYIINTEFANSYAKMDENSNIKSLFVKGDKLKGLSIDDVWMKTTEGGFVIKNQLELKADAEK